ncbi:MAG: Flp1 family type IVb pilin [Bacillota bacterium]|nr:Flp1 family type IVb pilin [Bacillota bacterium]
MFNRILLWWKTKWQEEDGMGTIEIVIIIAVLVALAFLFNGFARQFFTSVTDGVKTNSNINTLFTP